MKKTNPLRFLEVTFKLTLLSSECKALLYIYTLPSPGIPALDMHMNMKTTPWEGHKGNYMSSGEAWGPHEGPQEEVHQEEVHQKEVPRACMARR
jgi:hypothetical protein